MEERLPPRPLLALLLRLAHQHYAQHMHAALAEAGFGDLRAPHSNVFPFVGPEGITVSELAQLSSVTKQTMAQAVEQLEELGYVERRPDPTDRRARRVFLTPRGQSVTPVAADTGARVEAHWAELTSAEQIESLRNSLRELVVRLMDESPG